MDLIAFYILAQRDDDGGGNLLFWLIPVIVWVVGSILATLQKKKDEERRRRVRGQISPPPAPPQMPQRRHVEDRPAPVLPPPMMRRLPEEVRRQLPQQPPQQQQQQKRPRVQPVQKRSAKRYKQPQVRRGAPIPPPLPRGESVQASAPIAPARSAVTDMASLTGRPASTTAPDAKRLFDLLRPGALRSHFILTEVLQPPVGLRQDRI